ncbi:hypothetical protein B6D29_00625 [Microgenomates bacterium UTCPR1]|nr:nucleotidyltransferase domain-containing protein [Patescibacteria group bacterium]OQY68545.1 MAG: hypothetical protein B6D29_00625 [Microgenomates bacterium UTCPR1]
MEKQLASVFDYFAIFDYFPSFEEVYTFFPKKISKKRLKTVYEAKKYTVGEYSKNKLKIQNSKFKISKEKLSNWRFRAYVKLVSLFPQIKLVGLSGSVAMMNARESDDIDLFIITAKNRLFTARFIALIFAQLLGLRRQRQTEKLDIVLSNHLTSKNVRTIASKKTSSFLTNHQALIADHSTKDKTKDKVCLNLFFDGGNLRIPKSKQTLFVGHEVLQMKPLVSKDFTYEKFLSANRWVYSFFPNAKGSSKIKIRKLRQSNDCAILKRVFDLVEAVLKRIQLSIIYSHKTTEIITNTQLWFHPDDYGKRFKVNKSAKKL